MCRRAAAYGRIDRPEIEQSHHRLTSLDDIRHRLRLQRVQSPNQRHGQRQRRHRRGKTPSEAGQQEGPADNSKETEGGQQVDHQIRQVIMQGLDAAGGIIESQREIYHRSSVQGRPASALYDEDTPDRPKMSDGGVVDDIPLVVEDEWASKAVGVCRHRRQHDDGRRQQDRPPGRRSGRWRWRRRGSLAAGEGAFSKRAHRATLRQLGSVATFHRFQDSVAQSLIVVGTPSPLRNYLKS